MITISITLCNHDSYIWPCWTAYWIPRATITKEKREDHPFQRFRIAKNYGIVKRINVGSKESASFPSNVQLSVLIKTGGIS